MAEEYLEVNQFCIQEPATPQRPTAFHPDIPRMNFLNGQLVVETNGDFVSYQPIPERLLLFSRFIGIPIVQINGQRITGPPLDYTGPIPKRGAEVFVGNIPREVTEEELLPLFNRVGRIYQLRLMMDFSGSNRGFCFVRYATIQGANSAIRVLKNYEIRRGRTIGVYRSVDNARLQLDGIPRQLSPHDVFNEMARVSGGVQRVTLISKQIAVGSPVSAIVEYGTHRDAAAARRDLLSRQFALNGIPIRVEWAQPDATLRP